MSRVPHVSSQHMAKGHAWPPDSFPFPHHPQVGLILWCYLVTFLTVPGYVPAGWAPFQDEEVGSAACCNLGGKSG